MSNIGLEKKLVLGLLHNIYLDWIH